MTEEKIIILDFGSQYTQLIGRRIRELNVYCEIHPYNHLPTFDESVKGIILSGSPFSVRDHIAPNLDLNLFRKKFPVLGICYGAQLLAHQNGGEVNPSSHREYGRASLSQIEHNKLFDGIDEKSIVWMSHGDTITVMPSNFYNLASTESIPHAAFGIQGEETYGIQFHPEVTHSEQGTLLLHNFIKICACKQNWTSEHFIQESIKEIKETVGDNLVVLGLSGGVDSTVAAVLIEEAIGDNLHCIFIDNGLLRKDEFESVLENYAQMGLNVKGIRAGELFLKALEGIEDPEKKRKAIGKTFIDVFEEEAAKLSDVKWLAQGTIYPDIIESVSVKGPSATIKSHHNVGGLPEVMKLKVLEPLRLLFKDEVRRVGSALGIKPEILNRHPFPGPGLAIRILGEVSEERVKITQAADSIFINGLKDNHLYDKVWQAGAIFLPVRSVGVMGDERTYENVICLRAVMSLDGMTADWVHLPHEFLARISNQIINQVKGINRVVYDISSKPPATIEWE